MQVLLEGLKLHEKVVRVFLSAIDAVLEFGWMLASSKSNVLRLVTQDLLSTFRQCGALQTLCWLEKQTLFETCVFFFVSFLLSFLVSQRYE